MGPVDKDHTESRSKPVLTPERSLMTEDERALARRLGRCRFAPATYEKRFVKDMASLADNPTTVLTHNQREYLKHVAKRYRRQLASIP